MVNQIRENISCNNPVSSVWSQWISLNLAFIPTKHATTTVNTQFQIGLNHLLDTTINDNDEKLLASDYWLICFPNRDCLSHFSLSFFWLCHCWNTKCKNRIWQGPSKNPLKHKKLSYELSLVHLQALKNFWENMHAFEWVIKNGLKTFNYLIKTGF